MRLRLVSGIVASLVAVTVPAGCDDDTDGPAVTSNEAAAPLTLEIRPVTDEVDSSRSAEGGGDTVVLPEPETSATTTGGGFLVLGPPALTATDIDSAEARQGTAGSNWMVSISFTDEGSDKFGDLTEAVACAEPGSPANRIAIVVDDAILSAPTVNVQCGSRIADGTNISGNFTEQQAEDLADRITSGQ